MAEEPNGAGENNTSPERGGTGLFEMALECSAFLVTETGFARAAQKVFETISRTIDVRNIFVFRGDPSRKGSASVVCRWSTADRTNSGAETGTQETVLRDASQALLESGPLPFEFFDRWNELLSLGVPIKGNIDEFFGEERAALESLGIVSLLILPVMKGNSLWGGAMMTGNSMAFSGDSFEVSALHHIFNPFCVSFERHRVLDGLVENEDKFRNICSIAHDAIIMIEDDDSVSLWNEAAEALFGFSSHEAIGRNFYDIAVSARYDGIPSAAVDELAVAIRNLDHKKAFEIYLVRKDGTDFPAEMTISSFRSNDRWRRTCVIRDISERRRAMDALRQRDNLLETISRISEYLFRVSDVESNLGHILGTLGRAANAERSYAMIFLNDTEDTLRKAGEFNWSFDGSEPKFCDTFSCAFDMPGLREKWLEVLSDGGIICPDHAAFGSPERDIMRSLGIRHLTVIPVFALNRLWGAIGFERRENGRDGWSAGENGALRIAGEILGTALEKKYTEGLKKAKAAAEAANSAKSDFLANMSHEIRTPLNAILGTTEVMMETSLDESQTVFVDIINKEASSLLNIINQVLDLSRIEARKFDVERIPFDPGPLVEDVVEGFSVAAEQKGVELVTFIPPRWGAGFIGDPVKIRQVLVNLVGNAVKFTHEGRIYVSVSNTPDAPDDGGGWADLTFSVADTGIGIPYEKQSMIFDSFTQADSSTTRRYGGTGLGTTISKKMVELMGGSMALKSDPGKGSEFSFRLRLERAEKTADGMSATTAPKAVAAARASADGKRAFAVINDPDVATAICEYLRSFGMQVSLAADVRTAIEVLAGGSDRDFDLMIADSNLPATGALEMIEKLREAGVVIGSPILLMVSIGVYNYSKKYHYEGIDRCINKPVKYEELAAAVNSVLTARQAEGDAPGAQGGAETAAKRAKLLLVEDYPTNLKVASMHLLSAGYEIATAGNGREAVDEFLENDYDMILMDIQMPKMDGYEATREIRKIEKLRAQYGGEGRGRVKIVAMTAHAVKEYIKRCFDSGMDDYITKPLKKKDLLKIVEKHLERSAAEAGRARGGEAATGEPANGRVRGDAAEKTSETRSGSVNGMNNNCAKTENGNGPTKIMDHERTLDEFACDRELLFSVVTEFLDNVRRQCSSIAEAAARDDIETITREAHSARGGAANLNAPSLAKAATALEENYGSASPDERASMVARFYEEFERLEKYCRSVMAES